MSHFHLELQASESGIHRTEFLTFHAKSIQTYDVTVRTRLQNQNEHVHVFQNTSVELTYIPTLVSL